MRVDNFGGIQQYHDGRPVADYCNMIPMGDSVIDRHGESFLNGFNFDELNIDHDDGLLATFVDSLKTIYVATRHHVYVFTSTRAQKTANGPYLDKLVLSRDMCDDIGFGAGYEATKVTFAESSTKPSQVYMCDGTHVYYWNTQAISDKNPGPNNNMRLVRWYPIRIPLFKDPSKVQVESPSDGQLHSLMDPTFYQIAEGEEQGQATSMKIGWWPNPQVYSYTTESGNEISVTSVAWFDNRLILVEKDKNTVWLTAVDPSRWTYPAYKTANGYWCPQYPWNYQSSEDQTAINSFITAYYSSTASSARLQDVVAFAGQLYLLNDLSIEVWSATGNDQNPIQHNSQNTIYYGGRSPVIVDDRLYLLCRGAIHNEFVACIQTTGQIDRISNDEIEQRLVSKNAHIKPLSVRDQSMIVVYLDDECINGYAITREGRWWRYWNDHNDAIAWSILNLNGNQLGITKSVRICTVTDKSRSYLNGAPILRSIRGGFMQFIGRKIVRSIEVICDAGIYTDHSQQVKPRAYLRVSLNRGATFSAYMYRLFGASMNNSHVMIWRNCGSGNSLLLEFGTSDNVRFQIYSLNIEIA